MDYSAHFENVLKALGVIISQLRYYHDDVSSLFEAVKRNAIERGFCSEEDFNEGKLINRASIYYT
jgi:hypothetical protein